MEWVAGIIGLVGGFVIAVNLLKSILADVSKEELLRNKSLHWKYGTLVWVFAIACSAASVYTYREFFQ